MRSLVLVLDMAFLLPLALYRPFVGVLVFDMVSFLNPQQLAWGIGSLPPWALLAFLATLTGWFLSRTEPKTIPLTRLNLLIVAFLIGITVNMFFAIGPFDLEYDGWLRSVKIMLVLLVTSALANSQQRVEALIWVMVISIGYYILDQGGITIVTLGAHKAFGPPNSQIFDNNQFAAAVLVIVPLINYLRLHARSAFIRAGMAGAMGIGILTSLASYSRGALLGLLAMAFMLWIRSRRKFISLAVLGVALAVGLHFMPQAWWDRMNTIQHYQGDNSAEDRLFIWRVGWLLALRHPLTGAGFHATDSLAVIRSVDSSGYRGMEIHSIWLQILGEQGFVVTAIWVMMMAVSYMTARKLARLGKSHPDLGWAGDLGRMGQVAIVAYAVSGTFLPISCWDVYFTILTVISSAYLVASRELKMKLATSAVLKLPSRTLRRPALTAAASRVLP
jgi:putative inorganic carbon (hco3(-)) transporter